ncbi:hypothetical protein LEP1GSC020_1173 [Leptospira interrogans serovar Grippotyphosa str. 2006006986]|uniref:Uncharacterized protein n=1 Tax=Leptospira interrogans serovar Lora str. TE 1992 TaxID=1193028 RepID=M3EZI2_LEPIR|nr:hypothetical protein LEP1GSC007_2506 [Leptospira interrogans serovar Bulgarica str. Mallika]EKO85904.1 hypothetical protein LEP1GSC009_2461 [Leptospira interrogans serovar Grippotyphosa str. Andaman]EKP85792.1 hypothetical protein LEP1GSC020_1173 [Leptospira interrogans serovar Grippotyphosa str. 2006006986]EMF43246.1 hypothetical protein LEP1GSC067_3943 [Leptospira interrogans serovar Lora str. TE 1992]EMJ46661.1 hypothetical protein LEP1GSC111_4659 [Leptospira interrogans str. UT126]EMN10
MFKLLVKIANMRVFLGIYCILVKTSGKVISPSSTSHKRIESLIHFF